MFDHTKEDLLEACGIKEGELEKEIEKLPDTLSCVSEIVEIMCNAGDDPVKNAAAFFAFMKTA